MDSMETFDDMAPKTLLHACCGPCTLEPSRLLQAEGADITVYYANSNIHPDGEYDLRLKTLANWARDVELPVIEGLYEPAEWEKTAGLIGEAALDAAEGKPLELEESRRRARCRACYRQRFRESAAYAAANGFTELATTLSVSPYQYTDVIAEELQRAAGEAGLTARFRDFRPFYDEATKRSRELGMYRQNFCGCRFSYDEAAEERAQRKAERAAARAADLAAHADERAAAEAQRLADRAAKQAYAKKQAEKRAVLKALRAQAKEQAPNPPKEV